MHTVALTPQPNVSRDACRVRQRVPGRRMSMYIFDETCWLRANSPAVARPVAVSHNKPVGWAAPVSASVCPSGCGKCVHECWRLLVGMLYSNCSAHVLKLILLGPVLAMHAAQTTISFVIADMLGSDAHAAVFVHCDRMHDIYIGPVRFGPVRSGCRLCGPMHTFCQGQTQISAGGHSGMNACMLKCYIS